MQISRLLPKFGFERKFSNYIERQRSFRLYGRFFFKIYFWHEFISQMGHRDYRHNQFLKALIWAYLRMSKTSYSRENNSFPKNSIFNIFWKKIHIFLPCVCLCLQLVFSDVIFYRDHSDINFELERPGVLSKTSKNFKSPIFDA